MKKKTMLKFILLSIISIFLLYETMNTYNHSDPWGLTFVFVTLPLAILSIIALFYTMKTLKTIFKNDDKNINRKAFKLIYILPIIILLIVLTGVKMYQLYSPIKSDKIPEDYIAVFNGGSGERTYSTYIYKINNGQANYGFNYINTINTTTSWGSSNWNIIITSKGTVNGTKEVFAIAKENNAYAYVKRPNDSKIYTIDEYMSMFLLK